MQREDVASFVAGARKVLAATPEMGKRNTELRLVEPLLSTLGWDVRSPAVTAAYSASNGTVVDYALCPDGAVGAFVATAPAAADLSSERREELLAAMRDADVQRGAYTNGRQFVLVALTESGVEHVELSLEDLQERTDAVAALSYDEVASVTDGGSEAVADALVAAERDAVEAVTETVLEVAREHGSADVDGVAADVRPLARRFLDAVVNDLAPDSTDPDIDAATEATESAESSDDQGDTDQSEGSDPDGEDESSPGPDENRSPDREADDAPGRADEDEIQATGVEDGAEDRDRDGDGDGGKQEGGAAEVVRSLSAASESGGGSSEGEFVLRFFEDGRSVGAVGSSNVPAAVAQGVQYLLKDRGIGPRIQFPYAPEDEDRAFLHREPVHPDGSSMTAAIDLDGLYVATGGDVSTLQAGIEALAERGGLRVMFSGDWS